MTWTLFWDMHSGGGLKEKWSKIYIEAPEEKAKTIFYNRFDHSPERVTCTCCGEDYSISEEESLEQASAYHRNCAWDKKLNQYAEKQGAKWRGNYMTLDEYIAAGDAYIIYKEDIRPDEDKGEVPEQGYVWVD